MSEIFFGFRVKVLGEMFEICGHWVCNRACMESLFLQGGFIRLRLCCGFRFCFGFLQGLL